MEAGNSYVLKISYLHASLKLNLLITHSNYSTVYVRKYSSADSIQNI